MCILKDVHALRCCLIVIKHHPLLISKMHHFDLYQGWAEKDNSIFNSKYCFIYTSRIQKKRERERVG